MHLYLDDSGCGGVKFDAGSSTHLVMSVVRFTDPLQIEATARAIKELQKEHRFKPGDEYKFARCRNRRRHDFFDAVKPFDYHVRAIVIDKRLLWAGWRSEAETVKYFAMRQLLTHGFGQIVDAKLVIDGTDRRQLGSPTSERLMSDVNLQVPNTLREVRFDDSKRNVMLQLADMTASAIHRAVRVDEKQDSQFLERFRPRIYQPQGSFWRFK